MKGLSDADFGGAVAFWLGDMWQSNPKVTIQIASAFLDEVGAGVPEYNSLSDTVRADARYWADTASPYEIECYVAAGLERAKDTAFGPRMRKRMIGTMWRKMSPQDRAEFLEWAAKNDK